jgi:hypothetical protein
MQVETPDLETIRMMVEVQELMVKADTYKPRVEHASMEAT